MTTDEALRLAALVLGLHLGAWGLGSFIAGVVAARRTLVLAVQYAWAAVLLAAAILLIRYALTG